MIERIESIIIGAGQAGCSLSYYLNQAGREHILLEKSTQVADAWRNRRWDSFTLVTPNWTFQLPGAEYDGPDPHGFMPKSEIVRRFEQYEQDHHFPIRYSTEVTRIEPADHHYRYRLLTRDATIESRNVILATGQFQQAKIPSFAAHLPPDILQIPSDAYRNPGQLPPGAVLVIGSGQSGCQIAEELNEAGRTVYLSTSSAGRVPRRYRGLDGVDWLNKIGFFDRTPEALSSSKDRFIVSPHLTGKGGGHEINLHKFHRDGIILLGHTLGCEGGTLFLAPDLYENLAKADGFCANALKMFDAYAQKNALDLPVEAVVQQDDSLRAPLLESLDLKTAKIAVIVWATGYSFDMSLLQLPILDADRYPSTDRGVTRHPGLYVIGFNWMSKFKSGLLLGVAEATRHVADTICLD